PSARSGRKAARDRRCRTRAPAPRTTSCGATGGRDSTCERSCSRCRRWPRSSPTRTARRRASVATRDTAATLRRPRATSITGSEARPKPPRSRGAGRRLRSRTSSSRSGSSCRTTRRATVSRIRSAPTARSRGFIQAWQVSSLPESLARRAVKRLVPPRARHFVRTEFNMVRSDGVLTALRFNRMLADAWLRDRLNRRRYTILSEEEAARRRTSDTVFVFGSGYSLNEISDAEWSHFRQHDVFGFNAFY